MAPNDFNWRVIDAIERLIDQSGMTRAEVIARSGMRRNTFFVKMRGETALNTDDISKIARALDIAPEQIIIDAASSVGGGMEDVPVMSREEERELRRADHDLAAKRGRNDADIEHAE